MFILELFRRITFWRGTDRIGPDIPLTYWRIFFPSKMRVLCKRKFAYFHETAEVRPGSYFVCCSKISIGKRVVIRPGSILEADPRAGEHGIIIEDDVLLAPGVHMYVNNHAFEDSLIPIIDQDHKASKVIVIKRGAWIGANVVILAGVTVGENSVVGAGSIVTKDIPPRVVVAGNPAKIIRTL
ncbi:MAG: acetyltransferase [Candidatus Taylorbacteria bacterium CG11_big_fil_rev_8_21_14_0_20_46_11]|uniref:Acetyltransferase n=1 Tax=Candidatus Taylorbacteria bacterium CG11_big_fil_rev_8_21_14_0_20_46_11 TaxID=1975025 RepID=A0A2H0KEK4_9BACT|nr:MAG: acetyltransferase [Candidatus Taylorbacteria bacterium CG11_big_fil_rev_8_21_14_0_20_46_11]